MLCWIVCWAIFESVLAKLGSITHVYTICKFLISQYLNFTQPEALKSLLKFSNIETRLIIDKNFHGKGYLFRKGLEYNLIVVRVLRDHVLECFRLVSKISIVT